MKKIFLPLIMVLCVCAAHAAATDKPSGVNPGTPSAPGEIGPTYSIFSTSTDWQALTGLQYNQFRGRFIPDNSLIGRQGLVLYYLDGFPCYGLGFGVRVWLGPRGQHDGTLNIVCVYPPDQIKFTWRNATRDADQAAATGLLTCPVTSNDHEITIDLSKCTRETGWSKYQ